MTQEQLAQIEERLRFGTNTRADVRALLNEIKRQDALITRAHHRAVMKLIDEEFPDDRED